MKHIFAFLTILAFAFVLPLRGQEMKKAEKEVTVKGEVVDVSCYLHIGKKGDEHKACADACAKAGGALGILTKDGKLYVSIIKDEHLANPNAALVDHITHMVEVKGYVNSKGGVNGLRINSVSMVK